jgi:hypothetical protein
MRELSDLLNVIKNGVNSSFYNSTYCQGQCNMDIEERLKMFNPIVEHIKDLNNELSNMMEFNYPSCYVLNIAFLQAIYVQQDLIREIYKLFKIDTRFGENYLINRKLRNKLIGHPFNISKKRGEKDKFESMVLFAVKPNNQNEYIEFKSVNSSEINEISKSEVYDRHIAFLKESLTEIKTKIWKILNSYNEERLTLILKKIEAQETFEDILEIVDKDYEQIYDNSIEVKNAIKYALKNIDKDEKYKIYIYTFKNWIKESISNWRIEVLKESSLEDSNYFEDEFNLIQSFNKILHADDKIKLGLEIGFINRSVLNQEILNELSQLQNKFLQNKSEFIISIEYYKYLIKYKDGIKIIKPQ